MTRTPYDADASIDVDNANGTARLSTFTRGEKIFELSNHLGNVLVTISDKRLPVLNSNGTLSYYDAEVVTANDYYPFGMQMPGRKYQQANSSYRYGFNGQEKSTEIGETYTAEFWEYDPRSGRRWNVDPIKKHSESPYAAFGNNPIFLIDPKGADTISVNDKGNITGIIAAKGNHILLDLNKKQIPLNDPEYDTKLINKRGIKVGDHLVNFLSEEETKQKVDGQGKIVERLISGSLGETNPAGFIFYLQSLKEIKNKSYSDWDFSHSVIAPMVHADPNSNAGKRTRSGLRTYTDDYKYEQYYFFVFGKNNIAYNLGDAGNFMWGMAGKRSGFSWIELKAGSNGNEIRQFRGFDSDADQRAIKGGFNFSKK